MIAAPRRTSAMRAKRIAAGYETQAAVAKRFCKTAGWYGQIERDGMSGQERWNRALAMLFRCSMNDFRAVPKPRSAGSKRRMTRGNKVTVLR